MEGPTARNADERRTGAASASRTKHAVARRRRGMMEAGRACYTQYYYYSCWWQRCWWCCCFVLRCDVCCVLCFSQQLCCDEGTWRNVPAIQIWRDISPQNENAEKWEKKSEAESRKQEKRPKSKIVLIFFTVRFYYQIIQSTSETKLILRS